MKVSIFTCLPAEGPDEGSYCYKRVKITVDVLTKDVKFYPFKGSEHTVCNHKEQSVTQECRQAFERSY